MDKTAKKHFDAIQRDSVTKTNIIGIRKLLNATSRKTQGYSISCTAPKASFADADEILAAIHKTKPIVSGELHASGLRLLRNKRYKRRLQKVAAIVADILCFRLVGFEEIDGSKWYPVYEAIAKNGARFSFYHIPWQSGGEGPEILTGV